jgi:hypothetical protein
MCFLCTRSAPCVGLFEQMMTSMFCSLHEVCAPSPFGMVKAHAVHCVS